MDTKVNTGRMVRRIAALTGMVAAMLTVVPALAQAWPNRPLRIIVHKDIILTPYRN